MVQKVQNYKIEKATKTKAKLRQGSSFPKLLQQKP